MGISDGTTPHSEETEPTNYREEDVDGDQDHAFPEFNVNGISG